MEIILENAGKKFEKNWIFRNVSCNIIDGDRIAVLGSNGSGKSTLFQILAASMSLSEGNVAWKLQDKCIADYNVFRYISLSAPWIELIEEFTLFELMTFHERFKPFINKMKPADIIELTGMHDNGNKIIREFSTGMKQRVKLALALASQSNLILLDEPCSNLDEKGVMWYQQMLNDFLNQRTCVVFSNFNQQESFLCNKKWVLPDFSIL